MFCSQCGADAERCVNCGGPLCGRQLCGQLHDASCAGATTSSAGQLSLPTGQAAAPRPRERRERDPQAERAIAEHLVEQISEHRHAGRSALLAADLDGAFDELWAARMLEPDLDRLGAHARASLPPDWEIETDLTPLARALSAQMHPRAADAWRRLLDDRPARSVQAEAAEWLARDALSTGERRIALRMLHAASLHGRGTEADAFHVAYRQAGLDPAAAFNMYLAVSRIDPRTARALALRDSLTNAQWSDQDSRWWIGAGTAMPIQHTDHQLESLQRARDLAQSKRDHGWLYLAEGDHAAGPLGVRTLGRNVRAGCAEPADEDSFVRIRVAYDGAADRLPDVAWPWYRLAELLAWGGFGERARDHLAQAERRTLGAREAERTTRPLLRALVHAGLGSGPDGLPTAARPFPAEPFGLPFAWRLKLR